jgi:hypothetical protein
VTTAVADPSSPSPEAKAFRLAKTPGVYTLQLDPNMKLSSVAYDSGAGIGTGMRVDYEDYKNFGDTGYPSVTVLKSGGERQHVIALRDVTVVHDTAAKVSNVAPK